MKIIWRQSQPRNVINLATTIWDTETNFIAAKPGSSLTNSTAGSPQKFYRIIAN